MHRPPQKAIETVGVRPNPLIRGHILSLCRWMEAITTYVKVLNIAWMRIALPLTCSED
jgi:hypothetical protein